MTSQEVPFEFNQYLPGFNLQEVEALIEEQHEKAKGLANVLSAQKPLILSQYTQGSIEDFISSIPAQYYNFIKEGFEFEELRNCEVKFRFTEDGPIFSERLPNFITNTILWSPLVALDRDKIGEEILLDAEAITSQMIEKFLNNQIIIPYQEEIENRDLNIVIHDTLFILGKISDDFNPIMGLSINTETFIDLTKRYPRFKEILTYKLPEGLQANEIEKVGADLVREMIEIIVNDPEHNFLKPLFKSGTGIKSDQFKEFAALAGLKPNIDGSTMPVPVDTNFMYRGIDSIQSLYVDSMGGCKSLIMNAL